MMQNSDPNQKKTSKARGTNLNVIATSGYYDILGEC
jgi:hypothetical protein